jgi:hypothetical protein
MTLACRLDAPAIGELAELEIRSLAHSLHSSRRDAICLAASTA